VGTALSVEQAREIALYPDRWSQFFRTINGKEFSLAERPYLIDIYRQFQPQNKNESAKIIVLKCSRKVEKTETICNLLLYSLLNIPYFNAVYTAPRQPQVSRFVEERFNGALQSSINNGCLMKARDKNSISHQTFNVGARSLNHFYAYSNWGDAQALLGVEADLCCIDEYQDSDGDILPMLIEMLALSEYKWVLISGTAREQGSEFWKLWEKSSKGEWDGEKWNHDDDAPIIGYHISQPMHPEISAKDRALKKETYTPRRFANEVLGEFFAGSTKPLTFADVVESIDGNRDIKTALTAPENSVMGVDWGRETTVVIMDPKTGEVLNALKIDSRDGDGDEVQAVKDLILRYNATQVMCDVGYGARQVRELQNEFGERVKCCYYSSRPLTPYEYKRRDNNRNLIYMVVVDRTTYVEQAIEAIKKGEHSIPWKDQTLNWVVDEWCALNSSAESDMLSNRPVRGQRLTKYGRDNDDHAFHALIYARLAADFDAEGEGFEMRIFGD
jgi:hypothetical protein